MSQNQSETVSQSQISAADTQEKIDKQPQSSPKTVAADILITVLSAAITAAAFHFFANGNGFAPGGVNGLASMTAYLAGISMGYFVILFNLPIFILVAILVRRKTGLILTLYATCQAGFLILLELFNVPFYKTESNLIFAAIATGIVSGYAFSLMLGRFGASGGTYAISSLIKKFHPESNLAWVAFVMDSSVVGFSFFVYGFNFESTMCTVINLFLANFVADFVLRGIKRGFKFEIITDDPEELSRQILISLRHGVTELRGVGMYTHVERHVLICIVRKRDIGEMRRILRQYPCAFSYISTVNEVLGRMN